MLLRANRKNLKLLAVQLLEKTTTEPEALIKECLTGFERTWGHISHDEAKHLGRIDKLIGTHGVEGMLLDEFGANVSGNCRESDVEHDIQYCNTGDTYGMTILYYNGKLYIGDWGHIVESCLSNEQ